MIFVSWYFASYCPFFSRVLPPYKTCILPSLLSYNSPDKGPQVKMSRHIFVYFRQLLYHIGWKVVQSTSSQPCLKFLMMTVMMTAAIKLVQMTIIKHCRQKQKWKERANWKMHKCCMFFFSWVNEKYTAIKHFLNLQPLCLS